MRPLLCLLLCLITTAAFAQTEPPALIITRAGFYYVVTDSAGVPQLVRVTKVISIGDGGPDIPLPPDTPTPPANPVREEVAAIARDVDHPIGAKALSLVYTTVMDQLEGGQIPADQVWPAVKAASDAVLKAPGVDGVEKWTGARTKIGNLITSKTQAGELSSKAQILAFGRSVAAGLGDAAGGAAIDPELLRVILDIILRVIQLLFGGPV